MTTTALATGMTAADLAEISAMAKKVDLGTNEGSSLPVLKINYDVESKHERGTWVIGQKKGEDGSILDEGEVVTGMVILAVRSRYNLYNQKDPGARCSSPMFTGGATVYGSKPDKHGRPQMCGKSCVHRAADADPRCSAQQVVLGIAITESGRQVDCVAYIKGASYMPFAEYKKTAGTVRVEGNVFELPICGFVTNLGSEKKRNKGTVYYEATFERGKVFGKDVIKAMLEKAEKVTAIIDRMNGIEMVHDDKPENVVNMADKRKTAQPTIEDDDDVPMGTIIEASFETVSSKSTAKVVDEEDDMAGIEEVGAPANDDEFDIEAQIQKALAG